MLQKTTVKRNYTDHTQGSVTQKHKKKHKTSKNIKHKINSFLERVRVYIFLSLISVVHLRFYVLATLYVIYKHETKTVLSKKLMRDFLHGRKMFNTQGDAYSTDTLSDTLPLGCIAQG